MLKPEDKKVVDAFVEQTALEGRWLSTDGKTLESSGLGRQKLAVWRGKFIAIVALEDSRSVQSALAYLVKTAGKDKVTWSYDRKGFEKSLRFETGGDSNARDQYDGWVMAFVPGRKDPVGRLDWTCYKDKYSIKYVSVAKTLRRTGIATEMYKQLFKSEGITVKDLGESYKTPLGKAFRDNARLSALLRIAELLLQ